MYVSFYRNKKILEFINLYKDYVGTIHLFMLGFCNFAKLQNPNTHKRAQTLSAEVILIFMRHRLLITRLQL